MHLCLVQIGTQIDLFGKEGNGEKRTIFYADHRIAIDVGQLLLLINFDPKILSLNIFHRYP